MDVVADISMTTDNARARLRSVALERYDAVIVALGTTEAFHFTSVTRWSHQLAALLDHLRAVAGFDVVLTAIPSFRSISGYGTRLGVLSERHAARYNRAAAELCSRCASSTFVWLSPALDGEDDLGLATTNYRIWATELAAHTAPLLDASRLDGSRVVHDAAKSELDRRHCVEALCVLHTQPEARFDHIVRQARLHLNASGAALGFIDGDTLWYKSVVGATLPAVPFGQSFTGAAVHERGALIVPDAQADPRFRNLVHVTGEPRIRFWAGFPIEDDRGVRVGTLSVFDQTPRQATGRDAAVLRQYALAVGRELRRTAKPKQRAALLARIAALIARMREPSDQVGGGGSG